MYSQIGILQYLFWYIGYKKKAKLKFFFFKKEIVSFTFHTNWHQWRFRKSTGVAKSFNKSCEAISMNLAP